MRRPTPPPSPPGRFKLVVYEIKVLEGEDWKVATGGGGGRLLDCGRF